jgi:ATP-binding cassette subfamily B protein
LNSLLVEDIQGNRLIQTFALQKREGRRFHEKAESLKRRTLKAMFRWARYNPLTNYMTSLGTVAVIGVGGWMILDGQGDFGFPQMVAFLLYANLLYVPLGQLHGINHLIAAGKPSGDRVFEILDAKVDVEQPAEPKPFPSGKVHVRFDDVSFQYPERPEVLSNFHLDMPPGKITALVGHTGAGKSTVANLAMRTYDVTAGTVTINGIDIKDLDLEDLHSRIGHVAQDPFLFEGSVRENLMLAKSDASDDDLIAALEGASAWDFVKKLPEGLETNIGEKGIRLSQGEKQRMTIARVLLKNPPFVILDEATASVDTITERLIQNALENLTAHRTVLVIAHRLSTVRKADQIVCMKDGTIIEQGTHDELLSINGHYAKLWNIQNDMIPENRSAY